MSGKYTAIPYDQTNSFTRIALDLHRSATHVNAFTNRPFSLSGIPGQIREKQSQSVDRRLLHDTFQRQYSSLKAGKAVQDNIALLPDDKTFTITTGHQLCLFTGPLYFIYKIAHAIKLSRALNDQFPEYRFVPVYWMAGEDHDFAEVASALVNGIKLSWNREHHAEPVGRLKLDTFQELLPELEKALGPGPSATAVVNLVQRCYQAGSTLAEATRMLVHELFGKYGLLVLDPDDAALKRSFLPVIKKEITEQFSFKAVDMQSAALKEHYPLQIHPREINLFLFRNGSRYRIQRENDGFFIAETGERFSRDTLLRLAEDQPELFSPNVVLRPLYEEFILPNLVYIGGGGELAYWLQLKSAFEACGTVFPMLALRNSYMLLEADHLEKLRQLGIAVKDLFLPTDQLVKKVLDNEGLSNSYDLSSTTEAMVVLFDRLRQQAVNGDNTLGPHVEAHWKRNKWFLDNLEKKLYRSVRIRNEATVRKAGKLKEQLFPGNGLQERKENILTYLHRYGFRLIDRIVALPDAENREFGILELP